MKLKNTEKEKIEMYKYNYNINKVTSWIIIISLLIIIIFESMNTYKQYKNKKHNIVIENQIEAKK